MPRNLITKHVRSRKLANGAISFDDGDPTNGHSMDNTSQDWSLYAKNTGAGVETVLTPKRHSVDGDTDSETPINLQPGEDYVFDWFDNAYYGWDDPDNNLNSQNAVLVNVSSSDVKLAAVPRGNKESVIG